MRKRIKWLITAAVLLVCILAFNLLARLVGKLLERRMTSE